MHPCLSKHSFTSFQSFKMYEYRFNSKSTYNCIYYPNNQPRSQGFSTMLLPHMKETLVSTGHVTRHISFALGNWQHAMFLSCFQDKWIQKYLFETETTSLPERHKGVAWNLFSLFLSMSNIVEKNL